MRDDYLWDRSGVPDPEVQRLENLLGRFRHDRPTPDFNVSITPIRATNLSPARRLAWPIAVAATVAIAAAALWGWLVLHRNQWILAEINGAPTISGRPVASRAPLQIGESLVTDAHSRVQLSVSGLGIIDVDPDSRLTLLQASRDRQQLRLDRGTIRAQVVAPPYVFLVQTPTAYAMDMGCAYTLHVADDGSSILRVTIGWVDLQHGFRQSLVPAGAAAESRPGIGPGAPYFEDASPAFRAALQVINFNQSDAAARSAALATVLSEARRQDAFTLLNLFRRVDASDRARLYDRLAQLIPSPPGASRESAIAGDWHAMDPWWDAVGIGHPKKGHMAPPVINE